LRIYNTQVYGIEETIIRSSYPMLSKPLGEDEFSRLKFCLTIDIANDIIYENPHFKRMCRLGVAKAGSGHDCALKGIIVQADIEATGYWWQQFQRYHFQDIISSMSKMHRVLKFDLDTQLTERVKPKAKEAFIEAVKEYNADSSLGLEHVLDNAPGGLLLVAGVSLNYLQIKSMYAQRHTHRLEMWNDIFADWVHGLPFAKEFGLLKEAANES